MNSSRPTGLTGGSHVDDTELRAHRRRVPQHVAAVQVVVRVAFQVHAGQHSGHVQQLSSSFARAAPWASPILDIFQDTVLRRDEVSLC